MDQRQERLKHRNERQKAIGEPLRKELVRYEDCFKVQSEFFSKLAVEENELSKFKKEEQDSMERKKFETVEAITLMFDLALSRKPYKFS